MEYRTSDVEGHFKISHQTVRRWSDEFTKYLSPQAAPGKGKARIFTTEDMQVFALIAEMRSEGREFDDIHVSLVAGQRGDIEKAREKMSIINFATLDKDLMYNRMVFMQEELQQLDKERRDLILQKALDDQQLKLNETLIEDLRNQLREAHQRSQEKEEKIREQATQDRERLEEKHRQEIKERDDELKKLYKEIGGHEARQNLNQQINDNNHKND